MKRATLRFYAELNDFLPPTRRQAVFEHRFDGRPSIKDVIEANGVPHTEVDLLLVNGRSVDFGHRLEDGDRVSIYPVFESFDVQAVSRVRPEPLRVMRFVLDVHLGRLAALLRLAGFDTLYSSGSRDEELADVAARDRRILITRDRGLLKRRAVTHGYYVRATRPRDQLLEMLRRFDLTRSVDPFKRCLRCNAILRAAPREEVLDRLPPRIKLLHERFHVCPGCSRIYWPGSHHRVLSALVTRAVEETRRP